MPTASILLTANTASAQKNLEDLVVKINLVGKAGQTAGVQASSGLRLIGSSGHAAVSGVQASSAAIRVLEGGMTNNLRAVERFISGTLKLGPVLQAAFPLVGGLAFAGLMVSMGEKVYKFFKDMSEASAKTANAFRELNAPLRIVNDELLVTKDRLVNDIDKLQGKRVNTLALALDEARLASDKLAESLETDIKKLDELMKKQSVGWMAGLFGKATTGADEKEGVLFAAHIRDIQDRGTAKVDAATTPQDAQFERELTSNAILFALDAQIGKQKILVDQAQKLQDLRTKQIAGLASGAISPGSKASDNVPTDQSGVLAERSGSLQNLQQVRNRYATSGEIATLEPKKLVLEAGAGAAKKYADELRHLQEELIRAQGAEGDWMQKLDADENAEIKRLDELGELNDKTYSLVAETFDAKRITASNEEIKKYVETINRLGHEFGETRKELQHLQVEGDKAFGEFFQKEIEDGTKKLEEHAKAVTKLAEEYTKLTQQAGAQALSHKVAMVTAGGDHGDPLGALAAQQALKAADIQERYQNSLAAANARLAEQWRAQLAALSHIKDVEEAHVNVEAIGNINLEKANLLRERNLQLAQLQYEMELKTAEVRQKGVDDFFKDMQGQAQTAGNIFYESMHSGLDQISDQFAKLMTGQKTSFAKMFESLGETMLKSSIKSALQQGLGKLGGLFGIHPKGIALRAGDSPGHPIYAYIVNPASSGAGGAMPSDLFNTMQPPNSNMGALTAGLGGAAGGISGFLSGLFGGGGGGAAGSIESVSSSFIPMAEGGDVDPGSAYMVGEHGPEPFFPRSAGRIIPNHKMGGDTHYHFSTSVDARGSELGVENRVRAEIAAAHASAITASVQSSEERLKRTPQRKKAA